MTKSRFQGKSFHIFKSTSLKNLQILSSLKAFIESLFSSQSNKGKDDGS